MTTRNTVLTILLCTLSKFFFSQSEKDMGPIKISSSDSLKLSYVWNDFLNAIETKNTGKIKWLSLKQIDCVLCIPINAEKGPPADYIVPVDSFINQAYANFINSPLHLAILKRGVRISNTTLIIPTSRNLPKSRSKHVAIYEVWVNTYLPNEWAPGHEGQSHCFQFVKVNSEFKFYGFSSVP